MNGWIKYSAVVFFVIFQYLIGISQEIVFKYYYQNDDKLSYSSGGNYVAVVSNSQINLVETANGNILGSTNLTEGQIVKAIAPSDNGSYIAALMYNEITDEYILKLFNLITAGELNLLDEYFVGSTGENDFRIYWKSNDEFIWTNRNYDNKNTFSFIYSFKVAETYFYENFLLGNPDNDYDGFSYLEGYRNTNFKGYELSSDNSFLTILSGHVANDIWKAKNSEYPNFEIGVAEWGFSGNQKNYFSAFPEAYYNEGVDTSYFIAENCIECIEKKIYLYSDSIEYVKNKIEKLKPPINDWKISCKQKLKTNALQLYNSGHDTTGFFVDNYEDCLYDKEFRFEDSISRMIERMEDTKPFEGKWKAECQKTYKQKAEEVFKPFEEYYFNEGENLVALHYDKEKHSILGVMNVYAAMTMFTKTFYDLEKKYNLKNRFENYFSKSNIDIKKILVHQNHLPFIYDINKGTFGLITEFHPEFPILRNFDSLNHLTDNLPKLINLIENESNYYGEAQEFHFSPDFPFLFIISKFSKGNYALIRINTDNGTMEKFILDDIPSNYEFTAENKLILQYKTKEEVSFMVLDLIKFHYLRKNSFKKQSPFDLPVDLVTYSENRNRHLLIQLPDRNIDFNFSNAPFYNCYYRFDSTQNLPDYLSNLKFDTLHNSQTVSAYTFTSTPYFNRNRPELIPFDTAFFPVNHHLTSDASDWWVEEYIYPKTYGTDVPLYDETSEFSFNNIILKDSELETYSSVSDRVEITNYLHSINGYEWHPPSASVYTISNNVIEKWDTTSRKGKYLFYEHDTPIYSFDLMNNDSLMVAASSDGMISIWNAISEKLITKLFLMNGGKDWVFILPDNYYYGTRTACKNISFAFNRHALPMDYFDLRFNRPDKVLRALGCQNEILISAYQSAYQKRLEKLNLNEKMLMIDFIIPSVNILNLSEIPALTTDDSLLLKLDMYDPSSPLHHVNIYNNGVAIYSSKGLPLESKTHIRKNLYLELAHGKNQLEISVTNEKGAESYKRNFEIIRKNEEPKCTRYIISIGANEYEQDGFQLEFAAKDAIDFSTLLTDSSYIQTTKKLIITGKDVTGDCIYKIKNFLSSCKIDDEILLFYAGHGVLDGNFNYFLGTYNIDFNHPQGTGLCYDSLENALDGLPTLKKLIILDACHSGEFEKEDYVFSDNINPVSREKIKFRNVGNGLNQKNEYSITSLLRDVFNEMRRGNGSTVITSAGGGEFAIEGESWQNGVFTYVLKDGLSKMKADRNKDGMVVVSELIEFLNVNVPLLTDGQQTPSSRIINEKNDFKLR